MFLCILRIQFSHEKSVLNRWQIDFLYLFTEIKGYSVDSKLKSGCHQRQLEVPTIIPLDQNTYIFSKYYNDINYILKYYINVSFA